MLTLYFLNFLGYNIFFATFPIYASTNLAWAPNQLGYFFTILSSVMILFQGPVLSALSKRYNEEMLFMVGSFMMTADSSSISWWKKCTFCPPVFSY